MNVEFRMQVDSSFLKTVNNGSCEDSSHLSSSATTMESNTLGNFLPIDISDSDPIIRNIGYRSSSQEKKVATEQLSKMSLAKQVKSLKSV